jgi:N-acetylmuramoyl-L-alanine amidase
MKIFINPGHMPGVDSGAVNETYGVTEADIVKEIGAGVQQYLNRVGYDCMLVQSDNLCGNLPTIPIFVPAQMGGRQISFFPSTAMRPRKKPRDGNSGVQQGQ